MNLGLGNTLLPGDPRLIDHIVGEVKSQGIFDQFRKECIADVDTKPAYQNLRTRVEGSVNSFLSKQRWRADLNKNQLRETLRKHISDGPYLDTGVERIVDQVVNPKIYSIFTPQVEDVVYKYLGLEKPKREKNGSCEFKDLLPKDLDPVSPESDKNSLKDVSLDSVDANLTVPGEEEILNVKEEPQEPEIKEEIKIEEITQIENEVSNGKIDDENDKSMEEPMDLEGNTPPPPGVNDSIESGDKEEEEEEEDSPVFEPIDIMNLNESNVSNDSHLSGISELTSHRSRSPDFSNDFSRDNFDFSNQDSQLSKVSSDSRLSIVTDFGSSNHPMTPIPDTQKEENSKEKYVKENSKDIQEKEEDKNEDNKSTDISKQKENLLEMKDTSDTTSSKTTLSSKESSRDGSEIIKEKSEPKDKDKTRESSRSKSSKEKSDSRDSKSHRDRDKEKRKSNQSENSDKLKTKEKTEVLKDPGEKLKENKEIKEHKETPPKTKEEKPKESSGKESKDLKDIYKEKIRELREKKELTEKEKLNKDSKESNKESKLSKDSKEKRESSKDKDKHRSSSSSSRNHSSSRHESKSSRSSKDDSKPSRSESKDKSKRDERRYSKDGKNKTESSEKTEIKKSSKSEKDEKTEIKSDSKSSQKSSRKSDSHRSSEKSEKRDESRDKKRRDEKKSKSKDDHSSLRKNSNERRSSDRDGSNGSTGRGSQKSSSSSTTSLKPSSSSLGKESSNTSNASSETSDSIDENQTDNYKTIEPEIKEEKTEIITESINVPDENINPKRIDLGHSEISLPLKKRPLQNDGCSSPINEITIKKPKFARNFEEAKKLMKIRKKFDKLKRQSSADSKSPVSELSEVSETENEINPPIPDEERVQIIEVKDEDDDEPYPDMQCNLIIENTSKIILEDNELITTEMIVNLNKKSTLSEMELSLRQSLNEMICDNKNEGTSAKTTEISSITERRPSISQEESSGNEINKIHDIPQDISSENKIKEEQQSIEKSVDQINQKDQIFEIQEPKVINIIKQDSEDEEDCLYFLPDYERLNRFTQFLKSLNLPEEYPNDPEHQYFHSELNQSYTNPMAPPQPKRKYSTSPLSDILMNNANNNNDGPKIESTIYEEEGQTGAKKKRIGRPKRQRPSVSSSSPQSLINGENFVMPLSPESDVSITSEKNPNSVKDEKNRQRESNQRYTSDDLYKPRPLFASSSRRSRRSNPA